MLLLYHAHTEPRRAKQGLSLDDFEAIVQFSLLSGKLTEHLFADKIESYFVEHQLD